MPIVFTAISPHAPILLPDVGSEKDRKEVKKTIESLYSLGEKFKELKPDSIIISSPHPDWGFNVPLYFLARRSLGGEGGLAKVKIEKVLMGMETPEFYFEEGKKIYNKLKIENLKLKIALIASGDLSHCLREDGPYGFQPDGPKFDKELIESLKKKDIENILKLDQKYPQAAQCGLGSISFMLGILEAAGINWKAEILSYEGPFGVGYLVANFKV